MIHIAISTIMTTDVVSLSPSDQLSIAKDLIFEKHFHHLPVLDDGYLVGIITSFDLMKLNKSFKEYKNITVKEVMTKNVITLQPHEKVGAAYRIFLRHLFHGLPIVDENRKLKGIVTTHDILRNQFDSKYPNDALEQSYRRTEMVS